MTPLSPLDALGPAFRRTREVLAAPFRLGFFLKIALIAALTQPSFYSASVSYPLQGANFATLQSMGHKSGFSAGDHFLPGPGLAAFGLVALVAVAMIMLAIWVLFSYLYCRLRFTLFDLVVYKRGRVGQAWSAYGRQSWRYFGLVILVSLAFMALAVIVIGPAMLNLIRAFKPLVAASRASSGPAANPFPVFGAMLPLVAAILALGLLWAVVDSLMQDFLLPPMAIDDAPLESAFGRFFRLLKTDFGPVVVYVLLRFAVGIGLTWILMLLVFVVLLLAGLAIFGVGVLLYHLLWASLVGKVVCVALGILAALVAIVVYLVAIISVYGISAVFKQSYAVYFLGGRYPELGARLEPPPPLIESPEPPPVAPPSAPPELPPLGDAPPVW